MIVVTKGNTQSVLDATLTERLGLYPNSATGSFYLYLVNDMNGSTYSIPDLLDTSQKPNRINLFVIDETDYNFKLGAHKYYFYTTPTSGDLLESGRLLVTGVYGTSSLVYQ